MPPRIILAAALALCLGSAHAAAPKNATAAGLSLGATPQSALDTLGGVYKNCRVVRSSYHESPGETEAVTASVEINPGLTFNDIGAADVCPISPAGEGITDSVEAAFVHRAIDARQPLYSIIATRLYPDVLYASPPKLTNKFEALRNELFRVYGKPLEERRERIASSAANLASSLGIGKGVAREDYLVRYLWAAKGRLAPVEYDDATCDCGGPYVKAI